MKLSLLALCSATIAAGINGNAILPDRKSCSSSAIFGSQKSSDCLEATLSLRGGEVVVPESLADVESIIMRASNEGKLVIIDFTATWCGPCKMIAPVFENLSELFPNVIFLKVDVDENAETAAKYGVSAMPTFLFIKRGEVVDKLMGANPAALQSMLESLE